MVSFRAVLSFAVAGALLGILLVTFTGPGFIGWDNTAGNGNGMCICGITARQGAETLIAYQMRGTAGGAVLGLIAGMAFLIIRRKRGTSAPPAAAA